jgi:hypothetical protein
MRHLGRIKKVRWMPVLKLRDIAKLGERAVEILLLAVNAVKKAERVHAAEGRATLVKKAGTDELVFDRRLSFDLSCILLESLIQLGGLRVCANELAHSGNVGIGGAKAWMPAPQRCQRVGGSGPSQRRESKGQQQAHNTHDEDIIS